MRRSEMGEPLRALLVGAGGMGRNWAANLIHNPDTKIAGWVDIRPDAAAQAARDLQLNGLYCGDNLDDALKTIQPDFVVDVTIPEAHHAVTVAALAAGIPVLGEKPMADSLDHAREMVAASERAGKLYMVSQSRRYDARLHAYQKLIDGRLGPLGILNSDFYMGVHFGGFRDAMDSPLLLDMAIHTFDAARYLSGADPVAVYCEEFNPPWSWYRGSACATAIFEMTGGLRYTYRGSWCSEGLPTSWEADWRAVGEHGTATWDGTNAPQADVVASIVDSRAQTERHIATVDSTVPAGITGSLIDFVNALKMGRTPMGECHDNIKSLAMVFAAVESAATGQRVAI